MRFIHYTQTHFNLDSDRTYDNSDMYRLVSGSLFKPTGLWFSVEGIEGDINWKEWCESENFAQERLKYSYEIKFKKNDKLLILNSIDKIWEFNLEFNKIPSYREKDKSLDDENTKIFLKFSYERFCERNTNRCSINFEKFCELSSYFSSPQWEELSGKYDGIIIAPYQWELRLNDLFDWYYSWDCSSGCIWNLDCIQEFKLLEKAN